MLDKDTTSNNEEILNSENNEEVSVEEVLVEEPLVEETSENTLVTEEKIEEDVVKEESKAMRGIRKLLVGVIDQIVIFAASLVVLMIFDFILRLTGFFVAQKEQVILIIYALLNVIYIPICEATKLKKTIGKKVLFK
ncbi:hypothetical protein [Clostridium chauvoei]|uniref:RDD family protein n=2 Tax=Clostridium chauvoei TaxID=46867 RepID=S6FPA6_9CLOT|nr:hypothetical protein [Clostridium chauvoei]ATD55845.1 hypothetical protein BTM20_11625 [Clostridium chauvoei]ATD56483.1 hypothetical protein BTM21_01395 [Clostridium chauvoei]MBX7280206.1 hypothetical protein [Clostridium chauvoei]MBX7282684.1 hypothetical protein [Clostridium chauvoei]MBX7285097.1 hypothetical protein [Clostridium chauvoei]